ncbi:hypothetical protein Pmani_034304 [Petrolisthes manimaculis]|uniref:Uncharacterized protein n=1 Tax=Petrolisthes manimaculis TaxID=1843537 RepID=A0AAE1NPK5_9EUCA|nr:hypothetical protein Pmani_034304 [Petrolisthes manimaculis]
MNQEPNTCWTKTSPPLLFLCGRPMCLQKWILASWPTLTLTVMDGRRKQDLIHGFQKAKGCGRIPGQSTGTGF